MATSSKSENVVKLLNRTKLSGQFSQRLFRKLLVREDKLKMKKIVSEALLRAGHNFLGFSECGRYVLSYTTTTYTFIYGDDYTYHLYWWVFNLHSRHLEQVHLVRLFSGEDIDSDLYLTVCEWPNDRSKIVIFGFNYRSMSDENERDAHENIRYITIASMPPPRSCPQCCPAPSISTIRTGSGECLEHGYVLNSRYQVYYPFPTFQPSSQLKKDQVILLNTSDSLVACSISLCPGELGQTSQILYRKRAAPPSGLPPTPPSLHDAGSNEPGYVNYTRLQYRLQQPGGEEQDASGYEDDTVKLPFTVTDLNGRNLQLVTGPHSGQSVCVEQLTLDFGYLINEVIRSDASWQQQFCSFSDYDVVILDVCPETNTVVINIGLLLLAFSNAEEKHCRPNNYHSSLQVSWDLNTGMCRTVGVGDLTEVKGQTSGSVWTSYRKSCENMVMKCLVPESSSRSINRINRMTNEDLHSVINM